MKNCHLKRTFALCLTLIILVASSGICATVNASTPPSTIPGSSTQFKYFSPTVTPLTLATQNVVFNEFASPPGSFPENGIGGKGGNRLGNAPEAHMRNLEKFLAMGKLPPPNYPVPYVLYTLSDGGVEKFTDVFTKQPYSINVDDNSETGQGAKDIRVKTTISVNPLVMTTTVERLGDSYPSYLKILVTFPAYFYSGEKAAKGGDPYWVYGFETQSGYGIPPDITMTFSVDKSAGSDHTFRFNWNSLAGIPKLGFTFGTFQVLSRTTPTMNLPAFSDFIVSSPPSAFLTFETTETDTLTRKCMTWNAPSSFHLEFAYGETEEILGKAVKYNMAVTVDKIPQTFQICTTEDRAAHTYSVDYTASSTVDVLSLETEIVIETLATVIIDLKVEDMPAEIHVDLGDGTLAVDVSANVGLLQLEATADFGLAGIASLFNLRLILVDIPDFTATWSFVGFGFDAATPLGRMELALSDGSLVAPAQHLTEPDSNYLYAYSIPDMTALSFRLHKLLHALFEQDNDSGFNSLELGVSDRRVTYVLAHTEVGSQLTPEHNADLAITFDTVPTEMSVTWTVPFALNLQTNNPIASIVGDFTLEEPGGMLDLTAHAEILDIPANMAWSISPGGSITFTADDSIGSLELNAKDPNGLADAGSFFAGEPIRLLSLTAHGIPSFTADWSTETVTPQTLIEFNTAPGTGLEDLTFAIVTSETTFVTLTGAGIENRAVFYNDDTMDLGSGLVMEASLWVHVEDISSIELEWGGSDPTVRMGLTTTQSNELKVGVALDGGSALNPASPRLLAGAVQTSALPTSMDLTVKPKSSFGYSASGEIDLVTLDFTVGESPSDTIHGEIYGIPTSASASWSAGSFGATLSDRLDRVVVTLDNADGVFGSDLQHVEIEALDIPADITASWNVDTEVVTLNFIGGTYNEGLGEFRFLATTGGKTPTEDYINSLGTALPSMTDYSDFTKGIDSGYWPWVNAQLVALYTRHPTLDTGADDYFVYRTGGGFDVYGGKLREIGLINADLKDPGFADLEFSRNLVLARPLYLMMDDLDSDSMTLAELSQLPDGLATNSVHVEWDRTTRVWDGTTSSYYAYELSESIPYIDIYSGQHDSTSLTSEYTKLLFADVPTSVSINYAFLDRIGFLDFIASSVWQMGFLNQDGDDRYVGWLSLQSLHFDYSFALPGEEPSSFETDYDLGAGYRIFRLDTTLDAYPVNAQGVLGIYSLESGLESLDTGEVPGASEYIPEWTFILSNFDYFEAHILWDIGIGIDFGGIDVDWSNLSFDITLAHLDVGLFPTVDIDGGLNLIADFWWNSQWAKSLPAIPVFVVPTLPYVYVDMGASLTANTVKDYVNKDPIHLWPVTTADAIDFGSSLPETHHWDTVEILGVEIPVGLHVTLTVTVTIDVPGFHRMWDHPTLSFP